MVCPHKGANGDRLPLGTQWVSCLPCMCARWASPEHWRYVSGAADPHLSPGNTSPTWTAAAKTSLGPHPALGVVGMGAQKWYQFPWGWKMSLGMASLCRVASWYRVAWLCSLPSHLPHSRTVRPDASLGIYHGEICPLEIHSQIQSSKALIFAILLVD